MENIQDIVAKIRRVIENHKIADGQYARWLWQDAKGIREMGVNPYGCADAANILYSIGDFPSDPAERAEWVKTLRAMQDPKTGLFNERTHHPIHTTAHCVAALELFDAAPLHPMSSLVYTEEPGKLEEFLDSLGWYSDPWPQSHRGAGIYVSMNLSGAATPEWNKRYFDWLWENADPVTGLWRKGETTREGTRPLYMHMAGSFHYLFNHEYAHMPLRYPDKMIDTCIEMYDKNELPQNFGKIANFIEIDWIFCLTRASRQTPHRFWEVRERLFDFTKSYLEFWRNADWDKNESINDLHMLFGGVCALAELQQTLRGELITDKPLKLVLDRRPFI
jgi:hypothetical protein